MNRFEQRLRRCMQNEEFAAGYWEMEAELELMHAIDKIRKPQHTTHERTSKDYLKDRPKGSHTQL